MDLRTEKAPTAADAFTAALADLVDAVRQLEGLTRQIGPVALAADTCDRAPALVAAVCAALDVPLTFDAPAARKQDFAVTTLAAGIRRAQADPALAALAPDTAAARARELRDDEDARFTVRTVHRPDGTTLTALDTGPADAPGILFSPACAMSYRLSLPWLRALRGSYRCVVPQTRGTNEPVDDPESFDRRGYGVPEQADDLVALLDALDLGPVHLMGLCGGAVPALVVAGRDPRVGSLSVWHADLELGDEADKTEHQTTLRAVLDVAGESRDMAAWMRERLTSGPMTGVPSSAVGPLVVRPYATAELFYRYAKLTGATMHWDSRPTARTVTRPCLVVTSHDDHTAHPAGSRRLAELLPDARLVMTAHGTHLDAFNATPEQVGCLTGFLDTVAPVAAGRREAP
jgi:3-oxoadipate enol-lactonase